MSAGDIFDSITDFGSDLFGSAFDTVSSFTDSFGTEFLSATSFGSVADSFTSSISSVAGSLYENVGSFAGNSTWFNTFNPGSIVNSAITTVSDFGSNIVSGLNLPSVSIPGFASPTGYSIPGLGGFSGPAFSLPGAVNSTVASIASLPGQAISGLINTGTSLVNSTVANLASPITTPLGTVLSGSGFGIGTGYGVPTTPGFAGPLSTGTSPVNSTISNLASLPGQAFSGIVNTGARAVNATLSALVSPVQAAPTGIRTSASPVSLTQLTTDQLAIQRLASNPLPVGSSELTQESLTSQIRAVAQASGVDPDAPLTEEQLAIQRLASNPLPVGSTAGAVETDTGLIVIPGEVPVERDGNELIDLNTGEVVGIDDAGFTDVGGLNILPSEVPVERRGDQLVNFNTGEVLDIDDEGFVESATGLRVLAEEVDGDPNAPQPEEGGLVEFTGQGEEIRSAAQVQALRDQARQQQTVRDQRQNKAQSGDWRVRLRLAPNSTYLYNAADCGPVLWPLRNTDGVIFPYTPSIDMAYKANYSQYDLTHSNYRGYFYQNSSIDAINIRATFTAQDTNEANYLLATIHFFRSVTKMFYGQDAERGSPPPLTYLSGLGDFQFNEHPCVVSQFNYNLPADVDYIRAQVSPVNGQDLLRQRNRQTIAGNPLSYAINRLASVGLSKGALDNRFAQNTLGVTTPTYVPTKMEIQLTLLPIQSRQQVSKQFSVKNFANGNLLKGGFW